MPNDETQRTLLVIDTTEFWKSPELNGAGWPEALAWCRSGLIDVVVTKVTLLEAERHYADGDPKVAGARRLRQSAAELRNLGFLPPGMLPDEQEVEQLVEERIAQYPKRLRQQLLDSGVQVLDFPSVSHEELVHRDLGHGKPFDPTGRGYRDALNWASLVEHLYTLAVSRQMLFVSSNTNDFADPSRLRLDPELEEDVTESGHLAGYHTSLKDAVDGLRAFASTELERGEEARLLDAARIAVLDAIQGLFGKTVLTTPGKGEGSESGLTMDWLLPIEFTEVTVDGTIPDEATLVVDVFDAQGDRYSLRASIVVEVELDGLIRKGDYRPELPVTVIRPDWGDDQMNVTMEENALMGWYLTVLGNRVESITLDSVEPPDDGGSDEDLPGFAGWTSQGTPIQDF